MTIQRTGWVLVCISLLIFVGIAIREVRRSQVPWDETRFSLALVMTDGRVAFLSFDPVERQLLTIPLPAELAIRSRSAGEYRVGTLYALGSYGGRGGEFVRQKIQGFMRVPVPGYIVERQGKRSDGDIVKVARRELWGLVFAPQRGVTSLSRLDAWRLYLASQSYRVRAIDQAELGRSGVVTTQDDGVPTYHPERLNQYVGTRLFDWGIGQAHLTIAVVNASGSDGMGSDIADFLNNLGLDVVVVRSSTTTEEASVVYTAPRVEPDPQVRRTITSLLGFTRWEHREMGEYRADLLLVIGKDATNLF